MPVLSQLSLKALIAVSDVVPIRSALISVSDKMGLADLAAGFRVRGVQIYSTGGTRRHLEQSGIDVIDVAEYTGFPEMLDGRVKTLSSKDLWRHPGDS